MDMGAMLIYGWSQRECECACVHAACLWNWLHLLPLTLVGVLQLEHFLGVHGITHTDMLHAAKPPNPCTCTEQN
eukprot:791575-Pelagomonas_calceolata.AAC.3